MAGALGGWLLVVVGLVVGSLPWVRSDARAEAARTFDQHQKDIPFALIYLVDAENRHARLAASSGTGTSPDIAPAEISLNETLNESSAWPLRAVLRTGQMELVEDLSARFQICRPAFGQSRRTLPLFFPFDRT